MKEEVKGIINDLHNHFFDSLIALQKLCEVAAKMQHEDEHREQLVFSEEEEAFYEIIAKHKTALSDFAVIQERKKIIAGIKRTCN